MNGSLENPTMLVKGGEKKTAQKIPEDNYFKDCPFYR